MGSNREGAFSAISFPSRAYSDYSQRLAFLLTFSRFGAEPPNTEPLFRAIQSGDTGAVKRMIKLEDAFTTRSAAPESMFTPGDMARISKKSVSSEKFVGDLTVFNQRTADDF
jgi:hypothetical protein